MKMRTYNIYGLLGAMMILPSFTLHAQKDDIYSQLRKKYSTENEVFVSRKENATIKIEKDVPVIYSNVSEELMFLSDKNSGYDREVYWSDFSEIKDLDASSIIPDGKKFK